MLSAVRCVDRFFVKRIRGGRVRPAPFVDRQTPTFRQAPGWFGTRRPLLRWHAPPIPQSSVAHRPDRGRPHQGTAGSGLYRMRYPATPASMAREPGGGAWVSTLIMPREASSAFPLLPSRTGIGRRQPARASLPAPSMVGVHQIEARNTHQWWPPGDPGGHSGRRPPGRDSLRPSGQVPLRRRHLSGPGGGNPPRHSGLIR